ncbi:extracellular solute-binding protein [Paenibacillus sp. LMG 31456]|uniref:Extracellular solute-binding protein n=2 Tax=Paenibacillus foliorum TaxID=2654974 RepID=A0A972GNV0_9BACL|nr:extracellular solute-binding protein [Paenibacillus foliorum]
MNGEGSKMKMNLKAISLFMLALMMQVSLVACSGTNVTNTGGDTAKNSGQNKETQTVEKKENKNREITVWLQRYGSTPSISNDFMKDVTAKFKEKTGINVKYETLDWSQALSKYTLASTGGDAPDVADLFFLQSFQKIGGDKMGPMQINDLVKEIGVDKYITSTLSEAKVGNDFYGIPWRMDTRVLLYNTEHFKEAGLTEPPKNWNELIEYGKKLTKADANGNITRSGLIFRNSQARFDQTWFAILTQAGGKVLSDDLTKAAFNTPEGAESLQFMQDIVHKYKIAPKGIIDPSFDPNNEFLSGKASMMIGAAADFRATQEKLAPQMKDKYKAAVMPSKTGEGPSSISFAAPISIMKTTKDVEAAKEWVKFFMSNEIQLEASKRFSLLNSNKEVMNDPYFKNDPWLSVFVKQTERVIPGDKPVAQWSQIDAFPNGPIPKMATAIMAGKSVKDEIENAVVEINKILTQ